MKLSWTKLLFLLSGIGLILWFLLTGKARFITDLMARRNLERLDKEKQKAQESLAALQKDSAAKKEEIDAAKTRVKEAEQKVKGQEEAVLLVPAHLRDHDFNSWWSKRK